VFNYRVAKLCLKNLEKTYTAFICSQPFRAAVPNLFVLTYRKTKQKNKNWRTPDKFLKSISSSCISYTVCLKCYLFVPFIEKVILIKISLINEISSSLLVKKWLDSKYLRFLTCPWVYACLRLGTADLEKSQQWS